MDSPEEREKEAAALAGVLWELYQAACHRQVFLDGKVCSLCGDKDHAAFECRFNAFVRFDALRRAAWKLSDAWKKSEGPPE